MSSLLCLGRFLLGGTRLEFERARARNPPRTGKGTDEESTTNRKEHGWGPRLEFKRARMGTKASALSSRSAIRRQHGCRGQIPSDSELMLHEVLSDERCVIQMASCGRMARNARTEAQQQVLRAWES